MMISAEEIARNAFPVLSDEEVALLEPFGTHHATREGEVLFEAGQGAPIMIVVYSGRTEVVDRSEGSERLITSAGPGQFNGELSLLTGQTLYATCIVREGGEVLLIPAAAVQEIVATIPELSDILVAAFIARRQLLMQAAGPTLTLVGSDLAPAMLDLAEFLNRNRIPYRSLEPDDPAAIALLERVGARGSATVWVVIRGQKALADPGTLYLAKALGLDLAIGQTEPADLIVVGAGPAGLSAAVYGASEGLQTIVVDDVAIGGQAGSSSRIENYLGFPTGISGGDLAFKAEVQALKFGARITVPRQATGLRQEDGIFHLELDYLKPLRARSVIVATGARYRRLNLPNEEQFTSAGIYYAATELEARLCRKSEVIVVGAGNSAGQAAMFLAGSAAQVHLVCRGANLERSMSHYLVTRLEHAPNVRIHLNSEVASLRGGKRLEEATVEMRGGACCDVTTNAVFVMIGADPCTDWLRGAVALDDRGFVVTGMADGVTGPADALLSPFQTSVPGVFAVGDVRSGSVKRVASAVGEGSVVVQAVHRYLASRRPEAVLSPATV